MIARFIRQVCPRCGHRQEYHNHQVQPTICSLCTIDGGQCRDRMESFALTGP